MKIILMVQTLIILIGAYYWYATVWAPAHTEDTTATPTSTTYTTVPTTSPSIPTMEPDVPEQPRMDSAGPNDAGMEWPTIEGDLEVR